MAMTMMKMLDLLLDAMKQNDDDDDNDDDLRKPQDEMTTRWLSIRSKSFVALLSYYWKKTTKKKTTTMKEEARQQETKIWKFEAEVKDERDNNSSLLRRLPALLLKYSRLELWRWSPQI